MTRGVWTEVEQVVGLSLSGSNTTFTVVRRTAAVAVAAFAVLAYLYGPLVAPALNNAAIAECNDHAESDWRSYRLSWHVGLRPHWMCADASRPTEAAISLGWWTNPF